jgi:hypothetical protein
VKKSLRSELPFRAWYYFRIGYNTYLLFPVSYVSTLVTVYYLAIKNIPELQYFFSRFILFTVVATLAAVPVAVTIGWLHVKKSKAMRSEFDISMEANPYNYKLPPGWNQEVLMPLLNEVLKGIRDVLSKEGMMDASRAKHFDEIQQKLDLLLNGGYVGKPRTKI